MKNGGAKLYMLVIIAPLMLGACGFTTQGTAFRDFFTGGVEKASAAGLISAEKFMCRLAPVGSVKDRYGGSDEKAAAYDVLCKQEGASKIIKKGAN